MKKTHIGGQAVIEGVMMRGKEVYTLSVRNPEGDVVSETNPWNGIGKKGFFKLPIFRGMAAFLDSMITGSKILMRSAEIAGEDWADEEPTKFEQFLMDKFGDKITDIVIYFSVFVSLILSMGLFFVLPVFLGGFFSAVVPSWGLGIVESLIRFTLFLGYLLLISRMNEAKRLFQYHGAEHKTIACFEAGLDLTVENVRPCTRLHKRCGTSFLLFVMVISMITFLFVQTDVMWLRLVIKICCVPFIAGISYEVVKWAGNSESKLVEIVSYPGLCLQKITTAEPDDLQIETAIAAMKGVLEYEKENSTGSTT